MAVDERRRSHLFDRLAQAVGEEAAATMFDLLPPAGTDLATRAHLDRLAARMDHRFEQVDQRFDQVDHRLDQIDRRLDTLDQRFHEDSLAVRREITNAVAGQTRMMLLGMFTAIAGIAGLSFTFAQLF